MAITPYRPSTDLFSPIMEEMFGLTGARSPGGLLRGPSADVMETDEEIRLRIEMPGVRSEDIDVDLENNVLTVSGEKREERTEGEEGGAYHLSECRYGRFSRSFVLPRDVEQERINAKFDNGVLNVTIPKGERARRRRIEVSHGDGQTAQG